MVDTKDQSNHWIVYAMLFVDTVNMQTLVFYGFYTTLYTGVETLLYSVYSGLSPSKREGYLKILLSCGFSSSPVPGGSFVNFLELVKLQRWLQARCTANPKFLKLRGHSVTW